MSNRSTLMKLYTLVILTFSAFSLKAQLQVTTSFNAPTCNGYSNGDATVTPSGGTAPYAFAWSNGQSGQTTYGLVAGTYSVTVTDATAASVVRTVVVTEPAVMASVIAPQGGVCDDNLTYLASASGGTAPYTFTWRNILTGVVNTGANLVNPPAGSYFLEVFDSKGCGTSRAITVTPPLAVTVRTLDVECPGSCDGVAEARVTGGKQPFTYKWNFQNATTQSLDRVPGGTYTVTVTDYNGCVKVASGTVLEGALIQTNLVTSGVCTGNASASVNPTGGVAPYTVKWSNGATGNAVTGLTQGVYFVTVTDAKGCKKDAQVNVSKENGINLMFLKTDPTCGLTNGSLEGCIPGGGLGPYTFNWSNGATTQTITNVGPGTYKLVVTDGAGCKDSSSITVGNTSTMILSTETTQSLCGRSEGSASITSVMGGSAPFTYKWSNGATTPSISNIPAGSYTVTVTDATGCSEFLTINVTNSNDFTLAINKTDAACNTISTGSATAQLTGGTGTITYRWSTGATAASISNLAAGTYSLTVSDGAGCQQISSVTINNATSLSINTTTTTTLCNAASGSATVSTVAGGITPYSYKWSSGQTTQTATNLPAGNYTVTVTDASGCSTTGQATVANSNGFTLQIAPTNAACNGVNTGSAVAQVFGGAGGYSYRWSNGETTPTINNVASGTYSLTVTDASGCKDSTTTTIGNAKTLTINATTVNSICGGNTGSATVTSVNGGTAPFTYAWSNTQTTQTISNVAAGNYQVTITDASGCQVNGQAIVQNDALNLSFTTVDAACNGIKNGSVTAQASGGVAGSTYSYRWSSGDSTATINNIAAGTYSVTVSSGANCTQLGAVTVNNIKTVSLKTTTSNATCTAKDGGATITEVTNGVGPFTFKWSNDSTTQSILNIAAGNYSVTVTDANGCQAVANPVTVNSTNQVITATPTVTDASCGQKNGKVTFVFAGGTTPYGVRWSGGTGSENLASGTYTFIITDANGCQTTQTAAVGDKGAVKASFTATPTTNSGKCDSLTYSFTNTSTGSTTGATYKWVFAGNRTSTDPNTTATLGGSTSVVQLIATSPEGCSDTSRQTLNLNTLSVDVQDTAVTCQNSEIGVLAKNNNDNFPVTYVWTPTDLIVSGASTPNPRVKPTALGRSVVYVTISNALGCSIKDSVIVNSVDKSALKSGDISFKQDCDTRRVSFTNTSPIANLYDWIFGDPSNPTAGSNQTNPSYTYSQGGQVTVTLVPKLACLDTVKLQVPVRGGSAVSLTASADTIVCNTTALGLSATSNATKIEWSANRNFTPLSVGATYSVTPEGRANIYYVRAIDANGCVATDSVVVNNYAINVSYLKTYDVCKGIGKQIVVTNQTPDIITATWTPASLIEGSNTVLSPIVKANADGTLAVQFRNQYGCTLSDNIAVKALEVDAKAKTSASYIYVDDQVTLNAEPTGTGYTYKWTPAMDIANPTGASTTATPKQTTTFIVEVTNALGCKDTASVLINVDVPLCQEPYIFIPRAFSPNDDGLNDKMFVRGEYLKELEFAIYNRWGERVFYSTSLENGWDGTYNGKPVAPDVYGYYVKGTCKKGEQFFSKGNITVLK